MVFHFNVGIVEVAIFQDSKEDCYYTVIFEGSLCPAFRHEKELYYIDDNCKEIANSTLEHIRPRWQDKVVLRHFEKIWKNK